jgi:2,3-bisphosphoglycerate-dependent phosphoglycerate mutase
MPQLVLIRHGESQWNLENRFTGWVDVPLTPKGEEEARAAGQKLKTFQFDCAFTSALVRAQNTLRIVLEEIGQTGIPIKEDKALNERMYRPLVEKVSKTLRSGCFLITRVRFSQSY